MGNAALGRKQRISNEAWIETIKNIENIIPKSDIDKKVGQTVKAIKKITKGKKLHLPGAVEKILLYWNSYVIKPEYLNVY